MAEKRQIDSRRYHVYMCDYQSVYYFLHIDETNTIKEPVASGGKRTDCKEFEYGRENEDTEAVCEKLKKDLRTVFDVLPKDMQQLMIMNPEKASLLQESSHGYSHLPDPDGVVSPHR